MKEYWFYGIEHNKTVLEKNLTNEQINIIQREKNKINKDNYKIFWLGCCNNNKWVFKKHGFETITIDDHRGNIARAKLLNLLTKKFNF